MKRLKSIDESILTAEDFGKTDELIKDFKKIDEDYKKSIDQESKIINNNEERIRLLKARIEFKREKRDEGIKQRFEDIEYNINKEDIVKEYEKQYQEEIKEFEEELKDLEIENKFLSSKKHKEETKDIVENKTKFFRTDSRIKIITMEIEAIKEEVRKQERQLKEHIRKQERLLEDTESEMLNFLEENQHNNNLTWIEINKKKDEIRENIKNIKAEFQENIDNLNKKIEEYSKFKQDLLSISLTPDEYKKMLASEEKQTKIEKQEEAKKDEAKDVSQSTDFKEIVEVIKQLNPDVEIKVDDNSIESNADARIYSSVPGKQLKLPDGFYYNDKNGITNKHNTKSGSYCSIVVEDLSKTNKSNSKPEKEDDEVAFTSSPKSNSMGENNKMQNSTEQQSINFKNIVANNQSKPTKKAKSFKVYIDDSGYLTHVIKLVDGEVISNRLKLTNIKDYKKRIKQIAKNYSINKKDIKALKYIDPYLISALEGLKDKEYAYEIIQNAIKSYYKKEHTTLDGTYDMEKMNKMDGKAKNIVRKIARGAKKTGIEVQNFKDTPIREFFGKLKNKFVNAFKNNPEVEALDSGENNQQDQTQQPALKNEQAQFKKEIEVPEEVKEDVVKTATEYTQSQLNNSEQSKAKQKSENEPIH